MRCQIQVNVVSLVLREKDHFTCKDLSRQKYKKESGLTKDILVETTSSNLIRQKYEKKREAPNFIRQKYKVKI